MADKSKQIYAANKEIRQRDYEQRLNNYYSQEFQNKVNKEVSEKQAKDSFKMNMRIRDIREDARLQVFEKAENRFVDQLIFNEQAEKIALSGEENVFNERILATAFQTDELALQHRKQVIDSKFEYGRANRGIQDAITSAQTSKALLKLGQQQQKKSTEQDKLAAEKNVEKINEQQQSLKIKGELIQSEANVKQYENQLKQIEAEGQERARGRVGASAQRALQSIQAISGVNTALIADQLLKSERGLEIEKTIMQANKDVAEGTLELVQGRLGKEGFIKRESKIRRQQVTDQKKSKVADLKATKKLVAKSLGISETQFSMNKEQLGRSLLSAADAYERNIKKIKKDRYAADINAYASRQLVPQVQPELPRPYETPIPVNIRPPEPVKPVKSKQAGQESQSANPVLQGISGTASIVAGVAGAFGPAGAPVAGVATAVSLGAQLFDKLS